VISSSSTKEVVSVCEWGGRERPDAKDGGDHRQFRRRAAGAHRIDLRSQPRVEIRDILQRRFAASSQTRERCGGGDDHCGDHHHKEETDRSSERETDLDFNDADDPQHRQSKQQSIQTCGSGCCVRHQPGSFQFVLVGVEGGLEVAVSQNGGGVEDRRLFARIAEIFQDLILDLIFRHPAGHVIGEANETTLHN
jgi:hypothetical protein